MCLQVNSKEGFLTKLGYHRKNWKIRWFTLVRNELKYFNTKEDKVWLGWGGGGGVVEIRHTDFIPNSESL